MVEGLEVVIKYHSACRQSRHPCDTFAILKRDLAHLRVHSPSQKNVRRVNGTFILHWPMVGTSTKVEELTDSLHTRWFKLCSDDPEALRLRDSLSIESITLTQDGVLIRSTAGAEQASQDAPPGLLAKKPKEPLLEIAQQPISASAPTSSSLVAPQPQPPPPSALPLPPPPTKLPPSAPRLDRQPVHLKRRMSAVESPSSLTRQKLDMPDAQTATPLRSVDGQPQPTHLPTSPRAARQRGPSIPGDPTKAIFQLTRDDATPSTHAHVLTVPIPLEPRTISPSPPCEPGEMRPHTPLPILTPVLGPSPLGSGLGSGTGTAHRSPLNHPALSTPAPPSPYPSSSSSCNGDPHASRRRDRVVNRLTRELWDTRRQLTAMQAREQVLLDDLEQLGARPDNGSASAGAGVARNVVSHDELLRLEAELRVERAKRLRAERALSDVERECRAPFVVPALFQAFISISELSD